MRNGLAILLSGLLLCLPAPGPRAAEAPSLPDFDARYAITKYGIKLAEARYRLQATAEGYRMEQHTRLYGMAALFRHDTVDASSRIERRDGQLLLRAFNYRQTGEEKNRDESLQFDYEKAGGNAQTKQAEGAASPQASQWLTRIHGVSHGKPVAIETRGPVWDVLSFQLPLMLRANRQTREIPLMAVLNGELDQYHFRRIGETDYVFAGKTRKLLKLTRRNHDGSRELQIWLAPSLHNLPVVVENYRDGELHSRMHLEAVRFDHQPELKARDEEDDDE